MALSLTYCSNNKEVHNQNMISTIIVFTKFCDQLRKFSLTFFRKINMMKDVCKKLNNQSIFQLKIPNPDSVGVNEYLLCVQNKTLGNPSFFSVLI